MTSPRSALRGDPAASVPRRCPDCGARNPAAAEWCGQCLRRFVPAAAPGGELRGAADADPGGRSPGRVAAEAGKGPFAVSGDVVTWTCAVCETSNDLERSLCSVCNAPLAATLDPPPEPRPRDPGMAALASLFLPGAGHAYIGKWGQAAARAVTSTWVAAVALLFALEQGPVAPMPLLFAAASLGLWIAAAHDAYREAEGEPGGVLLRGRSFTMLFLGLIMLAVVGVLLSALAALP